MANESPEHFSGIEKIKKEESLEKDESEPLEPISDKSLKKQTESLKTAINVNIPLSYDFGGTDEINQDFNKVLQDVVSPKSSSSGLRRKRTERSTNRSGLA